MSNDLVLDTFNQYSITFNGTPVSIEEAKALYESGNVDDMNLSMHRLINMGWNKNALRQWYKDNP